MLFRNKKKKN